MKTIFPTTAYILFFFAVTLISVQAFSQSLFQSLEGNKESLESYVGKGKWSVVMLWAHSCHICNQEVEQYSQFHEEHYEKNSHVVGISIDGLKQRKQAEAFINPVT